MNFPHKTKIGSQLMCQTMDEFGNNISIKSWVRADWQVAIMGRSNILCSIVQTSYTFQADFRVHN